MLHKVIYKIMKIEIGYAQSQVRSKVASMVVIQAGNSIGKSPHRI